MADHPDSLDSLFVGRGPATDRGRRRIRLLCNLVAGLAGVMAFLAAGGAVLVAQHPVHPVVVHFTISVGMLALLAMLWVRVHWPRRGWRQLEPFTRVGWWRTVAFVAGCTLALVALGLAMATGATASNVRVLLVPPYLAGLLVASVAFVGPLRMIERDSPHFARVAAGDGGDGGDGDAPADGANGSTAADNRPLPLWMRLLHGLLVTALLVTHASYPWWSGTW